MLALRELGFRYPGSESWAFRGVDLRVSPGEIVWLQGRNGAGKTTILRVAAGLLPPSEGTRDVAPDVRPVYMNQAAGDMLAHSLTVAEQLAVARNGRDGARLLERFGMGLEARLDAFVGHLSGGQRQVVALASTVLNGSRLLCLDEFTSALDTRARSVATALIRELALEQGLAVLVVAHSEPPGLGTRVVTLGG